MSDLISREDAIRAMLRLECEDIETYGAKIQEGFDAEPAVEALKALPSAQPEQKIEELLPDGTLHLFTNADLSRVGRVLISQNGTHYGGLYYADGNRMRGKEERLMADLIDRGALYKEAEAWEAAAMEAVKKATDVEERKRWGYILQERTAFKHDVADMPSVDAVPVVRCKDCKHRDKYECNYISLGDTKCGVTDDWFCADGERRDDGRPD